MAEGRTGKGAENSKTGVGLPHNLHGMRGEAESGVQRHTEEFRIFCHRDRDIADFHLQVMINLLGPGCE